MMDCQTFLAGYSGFRDGDVSGDEREALRAHAAACATCARYDRVVGQGVLLFRALPELEVSYDFGERLRHRLYHEDMERAWARRRATPGGALATAAIAAGIALFAWVPLMATRDRLPSLPAVAVSAPAPGFVKRMLQGTLHKEASGLTSRLAEIGVAVQEMPYHDLVFRPQGPVVGQLAVYSPAYDLDTAR
ncbi:MAG TPA: zf-HC2 domain-containing protein [Longimicrobiaceae bacterium]|nr:zf-HC2 domain-containing protein [Longimicrobiaceae bacterium]